MGRTLENSVISLVVSIQLNVFDQNVSGVQIHIQWNVTSNHLPQHLGMEPERYDIKNGFYAF